MNIPPLFLTLILVLGLITCSFASEGNIPASDSPFRTEAPLQKGQREFTVNSGVMFSPFAVTDGRPTVNYTLTAVQIGYVLNEPSGPGVLRGNFEIAGEAFAGGVFEGRGDYIAGGTLWLRYNFLPPGSRWAPFAQIGGGICSADVDRRLQGQNFNFNLEAGVGLRYLLTPRCSLNLEYRYQHISNANLCEHNIGVNAQGPILGVSYFF